MDKAIVGEALVSCTTDRSPTFERDLIALMPNLRSFSSSLCGNHTLAEDMAQQTLMKAWRAQGSFQAGTNLRGWLFTILRNEFFSHKRRAWRETHWDGYAGHKIPAADDEQGWSVELSDASRGLSVLPRTQREALLLVGVGGYTYQQAADICGTQLGTTKSRVTRARHGLSKVLNENKTLPLRAWEPRRTAVDDILAQLSALAPPVS